MRFSGLSRGRDVCCGSTPHYPVRFELLRQLLLFLFLLFPEHASWIDLPCYMLPAASYDTACLCTSTCRRDIYDAETVLVLPPITPYVA
jgi:hypothetical protein